MEKTYQTETYTVENVGYLIALNFLDTNRKLLEDAGFAIYNISFHECWGASFDDEVNPMGTYDISITGKREFTSV